MKGFRVLYLGTTGRDTIDPNQTDNEYPFWSDDFPVLKEARLYMATLASQPQVEKVAVFDLKRKKIVAELTHIEAIARPKTGPDVVGE